MTCLSFSLSLSENTGTTSCRLWWAPTRQTTLKVRRIAPTSTWTSSSHRRSWPSTCTDWTATTSCTTRTSAGRAPASSSIRIFGAVCVRCYTTSVRLSTIRTWTSGGEARGFARLARGASTTSRARRISEIPEEESPGGKRSKGSSGGQRRVPCVRACLLACARTCVRAWVRSTRCSISTNDSDSSKIEYYPSRGATAATWRECIALASKRKSHQLDSIHTSSFRGHSSHPVEEVL